MKKILLILYLLILAIPTYAGYGSGTSENIMSNPATTDLDMATYDILVSSIIAKNSNGLYLLNNNNEGIFIDDNGDVIIDGLNRRLYIGETSGDRGEIYWNGTELVLEIDNVTIWKAPNYRVEMRKTLLQGSGYLQVSDNVEFALGASVDSLIDWSTAQTNHGIIWGLGNTSTYLVFTEQADRNFNFEHSNQINPTIFIHSANQSTTEWGSFTHDQTNFIISTGTGSVKIDAGFHPKEVAILPSSGYVAGDYVQYTGAGSYELYVATETVVGAESWQKVGAQ